MCLHLHFKCNTFTYCMDSSKLVKREQTGWRRRDPQTWLRYLQSSRHTRRRLSPTHNLKVGNALKQKIQRQRVFTFMESSSTLLTAIKREPSYSSTTESISETLTYVEKKEKNKLIDTVLILPRGNLQSKWRVDFKE